MAPNSTFRRFLPPEALTDSRTIAAAADEAIAIARAGDARRGLALVLHARQLALGLEIEEGELAALNAAAIVHAIRGDCMAAVASGIDAYVLARRLGDERVAVHALITLNTAAFALGALGDARAALERCVAEAIAVGDAGAEIRARIGLGIALGDLGDFDAAAAEFARTLLLLRQYPDSTSPSRVIANLANVHLKRGSFRLPALAPAEAAREFHEAGQLALRAAELADAEANIPVKVDALAIFGRALDLQGLRGQARARLAEAVAAAREARCRIALPWVLCETGRLALGANDIAAARAAYAEALEAAVEARPTAKVEAACLGLAEADARTGNAIGERRWRERAAQEALEFDRLRAQTRRQLEDFFARP